MFTSDARLLIIHSLPRFVNSALITRVALVSKMFAVVYKYSLIANE
jgi:hypothetical protein